MELGARTSITPMEARWRRLGHGRGGAGHPGRAGGASRAGSARGRTRRRRRSRRGGRGSRHGRRRAAARAGLEASGGGAADAWRGLAGRGSTSRISTWVAAAVGGDRRGDGARWNRARLGRFRAALGRRRDHRGGRAGRGPRRPRRRLHDRRWRKATAPPGRSRRRRLFEGRPDAAIPEWRPGSPGRSRPGAHSRCGGPSASTRYSAGGFPASGSAIRARYERPRHVRRPIERPLRMRSA